MRHAALRRCELMAAELLCQQDLGSIYEFSALDVRRLSLPILVRFADFSEFCRETGADAARFRTRDGRSAEGIAMRWGREYLILYDGATAHARRLQFTLAHELGHILLGHTDAGEDSPLAEREAHRFAAALLAPSVVLRYLAARDGGLDAERLVDVLPLSREAAGRRIAELAEEPTDPPSEAEITLLLRLFGKFSAEGVREL